MEILIVAKEKTLRAEEILAHLQAEGTEKTRKKYLAGGAKEPLFGLTIKALKPFAKEYGSDQALAEALYATGNYDAMYLAGMIAQPGQMTAADFDRWISKAYCALLADNTVAVVLADSPLALPIAREWIASGEAQKASAGWSTFSWLLAILPDTDIDPNEIETLLGTVAATIGQAPVAVANAMNGFVMAVGISFLPLHDKAVAVAAAIDLMETNIGKSGWPVVRAVDYLQQAKEKNRLGFKRKNLRC